MEPAQSPGLCQLQEPWPGPPVDRRDSVTSNLLLSLTRSGTQPGQTASRLLNFEPASGVPGRRHRDHGHTITGPGRLSLPLGHCHCQA